MGSRFLEKWVPVYQITPCRIPDDHVLLNISKSIYIYLYLYPYPYVSISIGVTWLVTLEGEGQVAHRYYLLTPSCRVLLEKLAGLQLVKKFPAFHGTRRFITALTSVRHLSLSWASPIQSTYPYPTSWRSILILSTRLRLGLPSGLFPSGFPSKTLYAPLSSPIRATCPAHLRNLNLHSSQVAKMGKICLNACFSFFPSYTTHIN